MIKKLLIPLLLFAFSFVHAETIKTDVLVIGGGPSGIAAAIQSARSNAKTLLIEPTLLLGGNMITGSTHTIEANRNIPSGIWGEFRRRVTDHYKSQKRYDTSYNAILRFEPYTGVDILKKWVDTVKNLTLKLNSPWKSIKKNGTGWEVEITINGEVNTVIAKVVIDATPNGNVATKAGAKFRDRFDNHKNLSGTDIYRTSIVAGEALPGEKYGDANTSTGNYPPYPLYCIPLSTVLTRETENLLITDRALPENKNIQFLPVQMALGQGAGAIAAFCVFFKTTTQHLNVRIIQGELLDYKSYLVPFTDIPQKDPHFRAVQQVGATGLLKGILKTTAELQFSPNDIVNTEEVKPILNDLYTRAFLWFNKEKPGAQFTIGNMLSLISDYTLTDPKILQISLQKAWGNQFKLTGELDLSRPITRLEFAVLANRYLNPFAKRVDLNGSVVN